MHVSKSLTKTEKSYKRAQRSMLDDNLNSYERQKSHKYSKNLKRKHIHCNEVYKTLNTSNLSFITEIFELRSYSRHVKEQCKPSLDIPSKKQVTFGTKSLWPCKISGFFFFFLDTLRLSDVLPNFLFTTSETMHDYYF